jgi:hypothetical protein
MRLRKLRIAWSVFWGLACVLLIVLWVRSYEYYLITYNGPGFGSAVLGLDSKPGSLTIGVDDGGDMHPWSVRSIDLTAFGREPLPALSAWGVDLNAVRMPYWFATSLSILLATLSWLRWRFSLRTLLIATTLVAVVLGVVVWSAR